MSKADRVKIDKRVLCELKPKAKTGQSKPNNLVTSNITKNKIFVTKVYSNGKWIVVEEFALTPWVVSQSRVLSPDPVKVAAAVGYLLTVPRPSSLLHELWSVLNILPFHRVQSIQRSQPCYFILGHLYYNVISSPQLWLHLASITRRVSYYCCLYKAVIVFKLCKCKIRRLLVQIWILREESFWPDTLYRVR